MASTGPLHDPLIAVTKDPTEALVEEHGMDFTPWFIPEGYDVTVS
jgi:hypothetical protein